MASAISFPDDNGIRYHFVDWVEWGDRAYQLASKLLAAGQSFDRIVALATGGLTLGRAMKDYLDIPRISSLHISFYTGIGSTDKTPIITQSASINLHGERVLVFDDINDSGATIATAIQYLTLHGAKDIVTATIFQKPSTAHPSDFFAAKTTDWIIFPDEIRETITILRNKWDTHGLSQEVIEKRLLEIGFAPTHLQLIERKS